MTTTMNISTMMRAWRALPGAILATMLLGILASGVAMGGDEEDSGGDKRPRIYITTPASEPDQIPPGTPAFLKVVDPDTLQVTKSVPLAEKPHHFYKVPYQNKGYVAHFGGTSHIEVVDLERNEIVRKIPTANGPRHMTFSEDGRYAWVSNFDGDAVTLVDTRKDRALWTSPVGSRPNYVEPVGDYVFAANLGGSTLTVLNAMTGKFVKEIPIGANPFNMGVSCDGRTLMSANSGSNDVSFVDVRTLRERKRVSIMGPVSTAQYNPAVRQRLNPRVSPDCKYLWVGNQAAGVFAVLDIEKRQLIAEVRAAESGGGSDIVFFVHGGPAEGRAIGTNRYSDFTTLIDPEPPFKAGRRIPAGLGTHYITFNEDYTKGYVSSRIEGSFSVYDMKSLTEETRVPGFNSMDMAVYVWFKRGKAYYHPETGGVK